MDHTNILCAFLFCSTLAQAQSPVGNRGFQLPGNGARVVVYKLKGVTAHDSLPRTLDANLYFKKVEGMELMINGVAHGLVFVPPYSKNAMAGFKENTDSTKWVSTAYNRLDVPDGRTRWWVPLSAINTALPSYRKWQRSFTSGAITLPVLVRPKRGTTPFLLDADVNLGTALGYRLRVHRTSMRFLSLLGFASLKQVKHTPTTNTALGVDDTDSEGTGLALGMGLSMEWDGVQTGFFLGCDKASGELGKTYVYQDALWIGFGIGVNLFAPSTKPGKDEN